jgi:hypothetical protein
MEILQQLMWTFVIIFACVSCFVGVRRDTFWFSVAAAIGAISLSFNGAAELGRLLYAMEGIYRPIEVTLEVAAALLLWGWRLTRWVGYGE